MDIEALKLDISQAPLTKRADLERLFLYVSTGDSIKPSFEQYLSDASSYQQFFDAIYENDDFKYSSVWADWANLQRKSWISRFTPKIALQGLRLKSDGVPVEFESGIVLAPTGSRDNIANFYVFGSGDFNAEAADFVTSIGGSFSCVGYSFVGVYGVYSYRGNVIFEEWDVERDPLGADA